MNEIFIGFDKGYGIDKSVAATMIKQNNIWIVQSVDVI